MNTRRQATERDQQAEELLFAGPRRWGLRNGLFQGQFVSDWVDAVSAHQRRNRVSWINSTELAKILMQISMLREIVGKRIFAQRD